MKKILLSIFLIFVFGSTLFSAGYQVNLEQSMKAMGMAGAFTAVANDPTANFYNPAGITQQKEKFKFTGSYVFGLFHPKIHDPKLIDKNGNVLAAADTKQQDKRWAQIPSFFATYNFNNKFYMGFGFFAPYGTATDWTHTWIGRYFADKTDLRTYDFNLNFAYKLNDMWSFAIGVNYIYGTVEIKKSISTPLLGLQDALTKLNKGLITKTQFLGIYNNLYPKIYQRPYDADIKLKGDTGGSSNGWGINVGILFTPCNDWKFGLAYRSQVKLDFDGDATYRFQPGAVALGMDKVLTKSDIKSSLILPDTVSFGVAYTGFKNWTLSADILWTHWKLYNNLVVHFDQFAGINNYKSITDKNWNDVIRLSLGAEYRVKENLAFRVGYIYDQSPVDDDTRGPELADSDRNDLTVGIGYSHKNLTIDAAYLIAFFKDSTSKIKDDAGTRLTGKYNTIAHVVGISLSYKF